MGTFPTADTMRRTLPQAGIRTVDIPDGSQVARATQNLGNAIEGVGATFTRNAEIDRRKIEQAQGYEAAAGYDRFQSEQKLKADTAAQNMQPGGAGLTQGFTPAYQKDADAFLATVPENLKPRFKQALAGFGLDLTGRLQGAETKERNRFALSTVQEDETRHIREVMKPSDPKEIEEQLASVKAKSAAFIRDNPNLSPIQKDELLKGLDGRYAKAYDDRIQADPGLARKVFARARDLNSGPTSISPAARTTLTSVLAKDKGAEHIDGMKPKFAEGLAAMVNAAPPEIRAGLGIMSGTRSIERQQQLWDASDKTGRTVARPGHSQHNHGNAADLTFNGQRLDKAPEAVKTWVKQNAATYGLALPMDYEPWHIEDADARKVASGGRSRAEGAGFRGVNIKTHYSQDLPDFAAAAIGGHAIVENGGRATGKPGDNGTAFGTFQWRGQRLSNLKAFAAERGSDWTDQRTQLDFAKAEGEQGGKYADEGAIRAWRELRSARTVDDAVKAWMHFERPQGYSADRPENGHAYDRRLQEAKRLMGQSGSGALEGPSTQTPVDNFSTARNHFASLFPNAAPDTLNTLAERSVRTAAAYEREEQQAETQRVAGLYNQLQTDILDGKAGLEDIKAARNAGWLTDADKIKSAIGWVEQRDKEDADNSDAMEILRGGGKLNPFDSGHAKLADRMFSLSTKGSAGDLGAAEQAMGYIQQQTGLVPKAGVTALRGAVTTGTPEQAARSLQVASSLLARNANAFAGTEDGAALTKSAMAFSHYAELGMGPDEAARRVVEMSRPEYQSKLKIGDKDLKAFQKTITDDTVASAFDDRSWGSVFNPMGESKVTTGANAEQKRAVLSDFTELASQFYQESGDADLARSMAKKTLSNVYGVTRLNGSPVLTKYPIEKAYPALPGKDGELSHAYVTEQASAAVKDATGHEVKPEDVVLSYIPNVTSRDFGQGRAPVYNLGYFREVNGQRIYDVIPNAGFRAEFEKAKTEADANKAAVEGEERAVQEKWFRNAHSLRWRLQAGRRYQESDRLIAPTSRQDYRKRVLEMPDAAPPAGAIAPAPVAPPASSGPAAPIQPEGYQDAPNLF